MHDKFLTDAKIILDCCADFDVHLKIWSRRYSSALACFIIASKSICDCTILLDSIMPSYPELEQVN